MIRFIVPQFGPLPSWFPAYLLSCRYNPQIEWLFLSDREAPPLPPNVRFARMDIEGLLRLASSNLGCAVNKGVYSQCDLRPAFGVILSQYLKDVKFWGHCDLDVIWGRLESVFSPTTLQNYDIITTRRGQLGGHCTIYRNNDDVNRLFEWIPNYREALADQTLRRMNESAMGSLLRQQRRVRVYWRAQHVADGHELDRRPHGWTWEAGAIIGSDAVERACLHFINWKRTLRKIDFDYCDAPRSFSISCTAIRSNPRKWQDLLEAQMSAPSRLYRRTYRALRLKLTGRGRF